MCLSSPKVPAPPPPPPPPPEPPKEVDEKVQRARDDEKKRAAAMAGMRSTILTGPMGITAPAQTTGKALLGQ